MSTASRKELLCFRKVDDPEVRARQRENLEHGLKMMPEIVEELLEEEGRLRAARLILRRVLRARGLALSADEEARIDVGADRSTRERWVEQAATATSTAEALR